MSPFPVNDEEFIVETREISPANLLMRIESFSLLSKYEISEYESREFEAGGYKWKITFYPNGYESEEEGDNVSVSLSASGTNSLPVDWEINAIFSFFLYNQISDNYLCFRGTLRRFNAMNLAWGFSKLISKKSLMDPSNGYLVNDNCVFGAEVYVIKIQRTNEFLSLLKDTTAAAAPVKRRWKLYPFSKLEDVWNSEQFKLGDYNWKVKLFPRGNVEEKGRCISIFLECVEASNFEPHQKVKADVVMTIKSQHSDKPHFSETFNQWFARMEKDQYWGYPDFIRIDDLKDPNKGLLVGDCCILEIEITVQAVVRDAPKIYPLWSRLFKF